MSKPIRKYSMGKVTISVWENKSTMPNPNIFKDTYESYSIQNRFMDEKTKEWKDSKSFTAGQLSQLQTCIMRLLNDNVKSTSNLDNRDD